MTDERLKEIEELVNAATPGPWETEWDQCDPYSIVSPKGIVFGLSDWEDNAAILSDCKFVSAAREIVPELLAEVRRLRAWKDEVLDLICSYGGVDGSHHKQWVLDQIVRTITGDNYETWVRDYNSGEEGPATYEWEDGIAP